MSDTHFEHAAPKDVGHETTDFALRPIVVATIFLVALSAFAFVSMRWLFVVYDLREQQLNPPPHPLVVKQELQLPPEPRLQADPVADLQRQRTAEDRLLSTYGWVDAKQGVVRLPVARAMELLATSKQPPARAGNGGPQ
ncbi:hypothetical protein L6Q96_16575 [Candidatus Binatia bacterium]|nr:hypothetical protein [Candidatus Binatia bacterium]